MKSPNNHFESDALPFRCAPGQGAAQVTVMCFRNFSKLLYMIINKKMLGVIIYIFIFFNIIDVSAETVNDFSRLNPIQVGSVVDISSVDDVIRTINYANRNNLKVSISGRKNSQGGHTAKKGGVVLNMNTYNNVVKFSPELKTIKVESGVTWSAVQKFINDYGLAVKVAQSANIFSVGGSLSANVHGRDPRFGTIAETVNSFNIVLSDGRHVEASRTQNQELFYSAIGGYGLLGVITEVELSLIDNHWLKKTVVELPYSEYTRLLDRMLGTNLALHYGRCSIVKNDGFFRDCISVNYIQQDKIASIVDIEPEKNASRDKYFFGLSRDYSWGKSLRWWLQGVLVDSPNEEISISRNNAMSPPISFLEHYSEKNADILQEYFVPKSNFNEYLQEMREILLTHDVNVLSMTLRFVPKSEEVFLNYAGTDIISVVLYMNIDLDKQGLEKSRIWTAELVESILRYQGKYYLTYQRFPTKSQFQRTYPGWSVFDRIKSKYDKNGVFSNEFYSQYF